ncbi:hypothetical protein SAMD00019534_004640, partial [Acytostelium subglobosum LB1]|uniref:hypothetical protein n=1 Tax=Acytostelium subglobosum LB1 TaxID=1410327 RepID=UPI00064515A0
QQQPSPPPIHSINNVLTSLPPQSDPTIRLHAAQIYQHPSFVQSTIQQHHHHQHQSNQSFFEYHHFTITCDINVNG